MTGLLHMLRIEVDGHCRGGPPIRPWVAEVTGTCPRYGLARAFVTPLNDWADARMTWGGRLYGMVATYPLREGRLYEVAQAKGKPSKRHLARSFRLVEARERRELSAEEALERADGGGGACVKDSKMDFTISSGERQATVSEWMIMTALRGFGVDVSAVTDEELDAVRAGDRVTLDGGVTIEAVRA